MTQHVTDALRRLRDQAEQDAQEPWRPGKPPTDAQILWKYIKDLRTSVDLARDEAFLAKDQYWATGNPFYDREADLREQQGIFG